MSRAIPNWAERAHEQGRVTIQQIMSSPYGTFFALEDRNNLSWETWRRVLIRIPEDAVDDIEVLDSHGRVIDEPAEGVENGRQRMADFISEFSDDNDYYRVPVVRRLPRDRQIAGRSPINNQSLHGVSELDAPPLNPADADGVAPMIIAAANTSVDADTPEAAVPAAEDPEATPTLPSSSASPTLAEGRATPAPADAPATTARCPTPTALAAAAHAEDAHSNDVPETAAHAEDAHDDAAVLPATDMGAAVGASTDAADAGAFDFGVDELSDIGGMTSAGLYTPGTRVVYLETDGGMVFEANDMNIRVALDSLEWVTVPVATSDLYLTRVETTSPNFPYGLVDGKLAGSRRVTAISHKNRGKAAGVLIGATNEYLFSGQIQSFWAHKADPALHRSERGACECKSFAAGDIITAADERPDRQAAVVVRVLYNQRTGRKQARRMLLLHALPGFPDIGDVEFRMDEFFPSFWTAWESKRDAHGASSQALPGDKLAQLMQVNAI